MGSMWALCGFVEKEDESETLRDSIPFDDVVV